MATRRVYKNPPIVEALCEFRFDGAQSWDMTVPGLIYGRVQKEFPLKGQQNVVEVSMELRGGSVYPSTKGGVAKIQFLSSDKTRIISVGPNVLGAHVLKPYPGWEQFSPLIERAFNEYQSVASPEWVRRIGVRYINRIEIPDSDVNLADYVPTSPEIPPALPQRMRSFISRVEIDYDDDTMLIRTLASAPESKPGACAVMLDLDLVHERHGEPLGLDQAMAKVAELRQLEREAFEALITDKARSLFDE